VLLACTLPGGRSWAHGADLDWHVAPADSLAVLLPLLAGTALYVRGLLQRARLHGLQGGDAARAVAFFTAVVLLAVALVWPLDTWAGLSFAAHMGQHMVLVVLAPPLLLLGRPTPLVLRGLPRTLQGWLLRPRRWPGARALRGIAGSVGPTAAVHGLLLWAWHVPAAFELALRHEWVHWLEHVSLLASALLFWRALLRARGAARLWGLVQVLVLVVHTGMLGALLALAPQPLYRRYVQLQGADAALFDQQLAGLIMWVPMGTVYLLAAALLAARVLAPPAVDAVRGLPLHRRL
jgi:putative membrane protein